jgi:hypothetical protein
MNAAVMLAPRLPPVAGTAPAVHAGVRIGRSTVLLFGEHGERLPRLGAVSVAGGRATAKLRLLAWPQAQPGRVWFLAVLQFAEALPEPGAVLTVQAQGLPQRTLALWPAALGTADAMGAEVAARAEGRAAELALFLTDLAIAAPKSLALRQVVQSFLAAAAEDDGVIEIVGRNAGTLVFQGWGHEVEPGAEAILCDPAVQRAPIMTVSFRRPDISAPASGLVQTLKLPAGAEIAVPAAVHVLAHGRLRRRRVLPTRTVLSQTDTAVHLRDMLPRLSGPSETIAVLRQAARPVFTGSETLSGLGRPISAALDAVVAVPGRGAFVMGWFLDPAGEVASVTLADTSGFSARLDRRWTRVMRPDVSAGFQSDPRYAALTGDLHGFATFAPGAAPEASDRLHLALETAGGDVAFLPVAPVAGALRSRLRRAAGTVDLFKPTGLGVVETALAPLIAAAAGLQAPPEAETRRPATPAPTTLLLALPTPDGPPAASLSCFLNDPPAKGEESLVIVLGPEWRGAPLAALEAAAGFYGLDPAILIAAEELELTEAWEIGARAVQAERYLCLGGAGLAGPTGWRRALAAGVPVDVACVAAPMLLYEDGSVRSLGFDAIEPAAASPYLRVRRRAAGLPAASVSAAGPRPCLGTALAGAMISARAHQEAGGFCSFGMTAAAHELAFFLRLAACGGRCVTLASIPVTAPEPTERIAPWRSAARLADALALHGLITASKGERG